VISDLQWSQVKRYSLDNCSLQKWFYENCEL
jgi:hypothetical protein